MVSATANPIGPIAATDADASDRQLLARFVSQHDEAAFAELVRRHGRTVWCVCRQLLPREQDAEDAFQAVFTVLARNAGKIRKGEAVGSWLYGVAYRIGQRARRQAFQRRQRESQASVPAAEQPAWSEAASRELQRILDEEVQRLPAKCRAPFVLCYLEGMSRGEAARELGWKEGTLSGRLAQARKLLEKRLARRGVMLSAVLAASALIKQSAAGAAPAVLVQATVQALAPTASAGAAASASPQALFLADGLVTTTTTRKMAVLASVVLTVSAVVGGVMLAATQNPQEPGGRPATECLREEMPDVKIGDGSLRAASCLSCHQRENRNVKLWHFMPPRRIDQDSSNSVAAFDAPDIKPGSNLNWLLWLLVALLVSYLLLWIYVRRKRRREEARTAVPD